MTLLQILNLTCCIYPCNCSPHMILSVHDEGMQYFLKHITGCALLRHSAYHLVGSLFLHCSSLWTDRWIWFCGKNNIYLTMYCLHCNLPSTSPSPPRYTLSLTLIAASFSIYYCHCLVPVIVKTRRIKIAENIHAEMSSHNYHHKNTIKKRVNI